MIFGVSKIQKEKQHEHNSECTSYRFDNLRSNTDGDYGMGRNEKEVKHKLIRSKTKEAIEKKVAEEVQKGSVILKQGYEKWHKLPYFIRVEERA